MIEMPITPRKSKTGLLAVIGASGVAGLLMATSVMSGLGEADGPPNDELVAIATSINAQLPVMIDEHTRLESATALPGPEFKYEYTIIGMERPPRRDQIVRVARPKIKERYRTAEDLKRMRELGVTLVYSYSDPHGDQVAKFEVSTEDL